MLRISAAMPSRKLNLPSPINRPMASTIRAPPPSRVARKTSVSVSVIVPSKSEKTCGFVIRQPSVISDFDARRGLERELRGRRRNVLLYVREDEVGTIGVRFDDREPLELKGVRIKLDQQFVEILEMLREHAQHFVSRIDRRFFGEFNASELLPQLALPEQEGERRAHIAGLFDRAASDGLLRNDVFVKPFAVGDEMFLFGRGVIPLHPARFFEQ